MNFIIPDPVILFFCFQEILLKKWKACKMDFIYGNFRF